MSNKLEELAKLQQAAEKLAKCSVPWEKWGYGGLYTCLDREIDIAKPDHHTRDWWPIKGPCDGCELARALGHKGKGTPTEEERRAQERERRDRREFARLSKKFSKKGSI